MRLENKVAVVTGASSGMGKAITTRFVQEGAKVVAVARRIERLEELAESLKGEPGEIEIFSADITSVDKNNEMIDFAVEKFGHLDILVNNAGSMAYCPTTELTLEAWDKVVRLSITGYFLMARECAKSMIKNHYGRIINIASMYGRIASFHHPILAYNTTKGAVPNFTRGLAQEWAQYGITVNAIGPGEFPSEMMVFDDAALEELKKRCPIARPGKIEELCGQLLLFASENSAYTTGQTIYIDGGWTSV